MPAFRPPPRRRRIPPWHRAPAPAISAAPASSLSANSAAEKANHGTTRRSRAASPSCGRIICGGYAGFGAAALGPNPLIDVEATPGIEPGYTVLQPRQRAFMAIGDNQPALTSLV